MFDVGVLLVRVVVGLLLFGHGAQKLFGWFAGPGLEGHEGFVESLGYRQPRIMARLHAIAETVAGLLLTVGLLTPLAAAVLIADMVNAMIAVHRPNGLWVADGGIEYPLVLAVIAAGLTFTGAGAYALDALIGWELSTISWSVGAIVAGLVVGLAALGSRSRTKTAADGTGSGAHAAA